MARSCRESKIAWALLRYEYGKRFPNSGIDFADEPVEREYSKAEWALTEICDWAASGQGGYTGVRNSKEEIRDIIFSLEPEEREELWELIKENTTLDAYTGFDTSDILELADIYGKKIKITTKVEEE